jgi:hypothetical protein
MKKLFYVLLLLVVVGQAYSQERWTITVKPPLGKYQRLPGVLTPWENPNKETTVYYTPAGVLSVGANFRVLPNSNQQDEVYLASNPNQPMLLFGSANTTAGSSYGQGDYVSTNGGLNWYGTDLMPNEPANTSDPAPAIDKNGVFIFTSLNTNGTAFMYGTYSTNYGVNWSTPYTIYGSSSDKNLSCSDDVPSSPYYGRTYTAWTMWSGAYPIGVSYTTNGGVSWSTAQAINNPTIMSQGADIVVGPGGAVYACWSKQSSGSVGIGFSKSTNGGVSWTANETIYATGPMRITPFNGWGLRVNDFPRIACDKSGGTRNGWIYIVECEKGLAPAGSDADVILHKSTDGGTTWSAGIRVNQDAANNGKVQWFPTVCVDPGGGVNVLYYDNRNYPSVGDSCETYMSRSLDGGTTWTDIKVSDHRWKPAPEFSDYAGDYIGITCANGKIWPFWFDNKTGSMQAWTAPIDLGPSIAHTPLGNTEQTTGTRAVNCSISPSGSGINPSLTRLYYRLQPTTTWTLVQLTNSSGTNWTGNITMGGAGTYNYYLTTTDSLSRTVTAPASAPTNFYTFVASADTVKPVITHTPIGNTPKASWPVTVSATVTDNIGVDSAWVKWYKNTPATLSKRFNLANTSGSIWAAPFNSVQADVNINDSIFYRIFARDNSSNHNMDSTALLKFKIIQLTNACIGTGTNSSGYPFSTYWEDGRTDILYLASEIAGSGLNPGNISTIAFDVISVGGPAMNGFNVRFQNTSSTSITAFVNSGWTTCFSGTYTVAGTGWQTIPLTSSFYWDGVSNILIEVCYNNAAWTAYSNVNATSQTNMMVGYYTDLPTGDGCTAAWTATSPGYRTNMCFTIGPLGTEHNSIEVPTTYSLKQNYPNPFNPVTKISYDIPKQGLVTMKVYDILGRQVRELVNEVKGAGSYSVDFNATDLSSGVYFYKLEANGFSDIKRMMLIK